MPTTLPFARQSPVTSGPVLSAKDAVTALVMLWAVAMLLFAAIATQAPTTLPFDSFDLISTF